MIAGHLDEDGAPCPHHSAPNVDAILALAVLGTRHSGFNHDVASKLQGMMMALDELADALGPAADLELQRTVEAAVTAAQDLGKLLNVNRTLGRTTIRTKAPFRELLERAGERAVVTPRGAIVDATVEAAIPSLVHALSLALDVCAGPGRGRTLDVASSLAGDRIELALTRIGAGPSSSSELLALCVSVVNREGGELRCSRGGDRIVIRLPAVEP